MQGELKRQQARDVLLMNAGMDRGAIDLPLSADGPLEAAARREVEQLMVAADIAGRHPERRVGGDGLPGSGIDLFEGTALSTSAAAATTAGDAGTSEGGGGGHHSNKATNHNKKLKGLDDVAVVAALVGVTGEDSAQRFARIRREAELRAAAEAFKAGGVGRRKAMKLLQQLKADPNSAIATSSSTSRPSSSRASSSALATPSSCPGTPTLGGNNVCAPSRRSSSIISASGRPGSTTGSSSRPGTARSKELEAIHRLKHGGRPGGGAASEQDAVLKKVTMKPLCTYLFFTRH